MKKQMEIESWVLKKQILLQVHSSPLSQGRNISKSKNQAISSDNSGSLLCNEFISVDKKPIVALRMAPSKFKCIRKWGNGMRSESQVPKSDSDFLQTMVSYNIIQLQQDFLSHCHLFLGQNVLKLH